MTTNLVIDLRTKCKVVNEYDPKNNTSTTFSLKLIVTTDNLNNATL